MIGPERGRRMVKLVGITGGSGSGKTSLAEAIAARLSPHAAVIGEDSYYRDYGAAADFEPSQIDFDDEETKDHTLLIKHLEALAAGLAVDVPVYSFKTHRRTGAAVRVTPAPVVIVEGIHVLSERLAPLFHVSIFVEVSADVRLARRIWRDIHERKRNVDEVLDQYMRQVRPAYDRFTAPAAARAGHVVTRLGENWRLPSDALAALLDATAAETIAACGLG
jgi:uridine kinase